MMIFGDKTTAIFDIWSVEHLITGIVISFVLNKIFSDKKCNLIILLVISLFWECFEHYLEEGLMGQEIQNWFAGREYWANRLIGDNLMMILGYVIQAKFSKSILYAVFLSLLFLGVHLYLPSSMDLQDILKSKLPSF